VKIDWRWKNQQQYLRWSLCNWLLFIYFYFCQQFKWKMVR